MAKSVFVNMNGIVVNTKCVFQTAEGNFPNCKIIFPSAKGVILNVTGMVVNAKYIFRTAEGIFLIAYIFSS